MIADARTKQAQADHVRARNSAPTFTDSIACGRFRANTIYTAYATTVVVMEATPTAPHATNAHAMARCLNLSLLRDDQSSQQPRLATDEAMPNA